MADLLNYLDKSSKNIKPDINKTTLDEFEALLNINRGIAKEIIKARVNEGKLDLDILANIQGVGPKTLDKAKEVFGVK